MDKFTLVCQSQFFQKIILLVCDRLRRGLEL